MPPVIDAHVHVWTDDRTRYPRDPGVREMPPERFTPEDLFAHTKPAGVAKIVLIQMSFYRFDNSYMLDMMKAHPGVFAGVGIVDSAGPDPARAMRGLQRQGVRGFRIVSGAADWLTSAGMRAMWQTAAAEGLAICPLLLSPDGLLDLDRMCMDYPETPVVIDHFARIGVDGELRDADLRRLCALARHRHVKVKASAFYALGAKRAPYHDLGLLFRRVYEDFGPRRMMWASDCPFQVMNGHQYQPALDLIAGMRGLSQDERDWVLGRTAAETFFS